MSGVLGGHGCCDSFCLPLEAPSPYSVLTPSLAPGCLSELCFFLCLMVTMTSVEGTWLPNQDNLGPSMGARDTDSASPIGLKPRRGTLLAVSSPSEGPICEWRKKEVWGEEGVPTSTKGRSRSSLEFCGHGTNMSLLPQDFLLLALFTWICNLQPKHYN